MDHKEAGRFWNDNAETWTKLARAGYDVYRDYLNTPAFFEILPDVKGMSGLDIGCGEGYNTRLLAKLGAHVAAVDISKVFINYAQELEDKEPLGIEYGVASAVELPFKNGLFDFATSFMCFMDIPEIDKALSEAFRVLKPGGFLQFSITHPCFDTRHRRNLRNQQGKTYAIEVGGYFDNLNGEMLEWLFGAVPPEIRKNFAKFKTARFTRTISQWFNLLVDTGFVLEKVQEPCASDEIVHRCPEIQDTQIVAYFLQIRAKRPL